MTLLTWNAACLVGVRAMDDQHGILMDTMNELRLAAMRGSGPEQVAMVLDRLIGFTHMHFWSEERLMEQHGFPGFAEHRVEHRKMLAELQEFARRLNHGEAIGLGPLFCILRDWYVQHIEGLDQQYGPWLNERGVQ